MSRHNYNSLSPQDFEELVRDLLQAEWSVALEAFKSGRDNGIDLRYSSAGDTCIIQCKHFANSGFSKLLRELRLKELPKIKLLNPGRYVVATTCGLTPGNKSEIVASLAPFVLSCRDVIGADDLDGLLARHPQVERANFKLWLTSTEVLERVLHNAELSQTDFQIDRVRRKLPLFVQGQAFPRAKKMLEEHQVAVISGVPGIGKTTLAEMLLYAHLNDGYEPVVIQAEISEGRKFFRPKSRQIFYYDDFLGQTFLGDRREYFGRNQDAALIDFMEMIAQTPQSRFVLTTREHILSSAMMYSEKMRHSHISKRHCILELSDYSTAQRAQILYNHLFFSDLPKEYCDEILKDDFFLTIIKHEHFNPRLIEWLASYARLHDVQAAAYQKHVTELLESPNSIWEHAFDHQISDSARNVLVSLYVTGQWVETKKLEPVFSSLHNYSAQKYNRPIQSRDFRHALQELDGAFLTYKSGHASFINPSVRDFLENIISNDVELAKDIIVSAIRFQQVSHVWDLARSRPDSAIMTMFRACPTLLVHAFSKLQFGPALDWETQTDGVRIGTHIDLSDEGRIGCLAEAANFLKSRELVVLTVKAAELLIAKWKNTSPEVQSVLGMLEDLPEEKWFFKNGGEAVYLTLVDNMMNELYCASASDYIALIEFQQKEIGWNENDEARLSKALVHYESSGAADDRRNCSSISELSELRDGLDRLYSKFGIDLKYEIDRVDEEIAEREEREQDREYRSGGSGRASSRPSAPTMSDDEVRDMFRTLEQRD